MPKIAYKEHRFKSDALAIIKNANKIIEEYAAAGYDLTLRQLYYQFVARDLIKNKQSEYKRLGSIINDARLAGLIDWNRIEDRTRGLESLSTWTSPHSILKTCASQFKISFWENQKYWPEVWIEKEALAGVFKRICQELRVPYLSCRGYTSQSEMWRAAMRLGEQENDGKIPVILHFGDHDPSGVDMSRDIETRLKMFMNSGTELQFKRLALNMDQVEEHQPPPNPCKMTDIRAEKYVEEYGDESWELDALNPDILSGLVRESVEDLINQTRWDESVEEENEHKRLLGVVAKDWDNITKKL